MLGSEAQPIDEHGRTHLVNVTTQIVPWWAYAGSRQAVQGSSFYFGKSYRTTSRADTQTRDRAQACLYMAYHTSAAQYIPVRGPTNPTCQTVLCTNSPATHAPLHVAGVAVLLAHARCIHGEEMDSFYMKQC